MAKKISAISTEQAVKTPHFEDVIVPFNQLLLSPDNVRKSYSAEAIQEMAATLKAVGLISPLIVTKSNDNVFMVCAGQRRWLGLGVVVGEGVLPTDSPIKCRLIDAVDAPLISLIENVSQEAMGAYDQMVAFSELHKNGVSVGKIADQFGRTVLYVEKALRLAGVAPEILEAYRTEVIDRDALMAYAAHPNQERQLMVWQSLNEHQRGSGWQIKRQLTENELPEDHEQVLALGLEAYIANGGAIRFDLFDQVTYVTDIDLLSSMLAAKIEETKATALAEGWSFVEVKLENAMSGYSKVDPVYHEPSPKQAKELKGIDEAIAAIHKQQEDFDFDADETGDEYDKLCDRAEVLENERETLMDSLVNIDGYDKSLYGALVTIQGGQIKIIRPVDSVSARRKASTTASAAGDEQTAKPKDESDKLRLNLTSHHTAAAQATLLDKPPIVAVAALAAKLALGVLSPSHYSRGSLCVQLTKCGYDMERHAPNIKESRAVALIEARAEHWLSVLPEDEDAWYGWLVEQGMDTVLELLVYCTSQSLNLIGSNVAAKRNDDFLQAIDVDLTKWWTVNAESYFSAVNKAAIIEAVVEGAGHEASVGMAAMKKPLAIEHAVRALEGKNWLPKTLRG